MLAGTSNYRVLSDGVAKNIRSEAGHIKGASFQSLTKKQLMDLHSTVQKLKDQSKKEPKRTFYIDVDNEGECSIQVLYTRGDSIAAYRNGAEIALPQPQPLNQPGEKTSTKAGKSKKDVLVSTRKDNMVVVGTAIEENKTKQVMPNEETQEGTLAKKKAAPKKASKKTAAKKSAPKKAGKKVAKKSTVKKAAGELPQGKKMKITVKQAIALANKGAMIFRASNGGGFGLTYLKKVKNPDKEMELIVRQ
jgi:hypothetical protein